MSGKRRLLVISHGFPPYYGGAEHAAGHLAAAAAASGRWEVDALTSDIGGRLPASEEWRGVRIARVPTRKKEWRQHSAPELLSFFLAAVRRRDLAPPDWILAHFTLPAGGVARLLARRYRRPYAVVLHGSDVPGHQNTRFGGLYPFVTPWIRRIWSGARRVIAVSDPLRDLALRTWPKGRIEVVPNGVDTDRFHPLAETRAARSDGRIVLMAVARLVEFKGLQHLIAALAQLPPDVRARVFLSLCGTGPYEGELRRQAREAGLETQVEFAGLVPYEQIPARLREADGFVLPSLKEGLPLSLLEAMASGLPVLASAVGGIPDLVRDGANGLLAPAGDVPALREALLRLAGDPALRARLGESARRTVMAWSWASIWERYEALFSESCRPQGVAQCG